MAILPVKCNKCGNTVSVDTAKHGMKCPSCGAWVNIVRVLQKQHPEWVRLVGQEKKLNEELHNLDAYENTYEYSASKARRFFHKYRVLLIVLTIEAVLYISSFFVSIFSPPRNIGEALLCFVLINLPFLFYYLPMVIRSINERNDEKNGINYARETRPKVEGKLAGIAKEKEEYLERFGENATVKEDPAQQESS